MASESLKPQFFVTRQNGNMVPLIAMDELPSTVNIRNVSRSLSPHDIPGMTGIGTYDARHLHHIVEPSHAGRLMDRSMTGNLTPIHGDRSVMSSKYAGFEHRLGTTNTNDYPLPPKAYGIHEQPPASSPAPSHLGPVRQPLAPPPTPTLAPFTGPAFNNVRIDRNDRVHANPAPLPPWHDVTALSLASAPGIKEYCSYWLRHGECDYAQQGCLYKHEMPLDKVTLERLGLRDIPKWYREKHGLGSYLAASGGPTSPEIGDRKRKEDILSQTTWRRGVSKERRQSDTEHIGAETAKIQLNASNRQDGRTASASRRRLSNSNPSTLRSRQAKLHTAKVVTMSMLEHKPQVWVGETMKEKQRRKTLMEIERYEQKDRERTKMLEEMMKSEDAISTAGEKASDSGTSTPRSANLDKADVKANADAAVDTPLISTASSDSDEAGAAPGAGGLKQAQVRATAKYDAAGNGKARRGAGGRDGKKKVHRRRRLAPPSESGESTAAAKKGEAPKVQEKSLLDGYDHSD